MEQIFLFLLIPFLLFISFPHSGFGGYEGKGAVSPLINTHEMIWIIVVGE